jgi:hypothetical protein
MKPVIRSIVAILLLGSCNPRGADWQSIPVELVDSENAYGLPVATLARVPTDLGEDWEKWASRHCPGEPERRDGWIVHRNRDLQRPVAVLGRGTDRNLGGGLRTGAAGDGQANVTPRIARQTTERNALDVAHVPIVADGVVDLDLSAGVDGGGADACRDSGF